MKPLLCVWPCIILHCTSLNTHDSPAKYQYYYINFIFILQRGKLRPREAQKVALGHAVGREGSDIKVSVLYFILCPPMNSTFVEPWLLGEAAVVEEGGCVWNEELKLDHETPWKSDQGVWYSVLGGIVIDAALLSHRAGCYPRAGGYKLIPWDQMKNIKTS